MDYRKLISFGKGGYVISIPKSWILENKLEKGAIISVEHQENCLLISPSPDENKNKETNSFHIQIDDLTPPLVNALLIDAYTNSEPQIQLSGNTLKDALPEIKQHIQNLIALEVIESDKNKIIVKDYLNLSDISIKQIIRKMDMVIRSIFGDLKENNSRISLHAGEIDRNFYLTLKALKRTAYDHSLLKTFEITTTDVFNVWQTALSLRAMSKELETLITRLSPLPNQQKNAALTLIAELETFYLHTMKAFHKKETHALLDAEAQRQKLTAHTKEFADKHANDPAPLLLAENLKAISTHTNALLHIAATGR